MEGFCMQGDQNIQKPDDAVEIDQGIKNKLTNAGTVISGTDGMTVEDEQYGDSSDKKLSNNLRITLININVLPEFNSHPINGLLFQALSSIQTDILLMNETDKCWHRMKESNRWHSRSRGWWESSKSTIAYNTQDISNTAYQPGGCLITSINKSSHRVLNCRIDHRKLGRWAW
jgi:hypothetical protein